MKKILNWIKQSNEDMGIVYMLWVVPTYFVVVVVMPIVISVGIGYGVFELVSKILE